MRAEDEPENGRPTQMYLESWYNWPVFRLLNRESTMTCAFLALFLPGQAPVGYYDPKRQMTPATTAKAELQVQNSSYELWFTLTNRLLLQPPLRNTGFIRSSLDLSFLSFNSGGAELRATNKIRPANAPTIVPEFGGLKNATSFNMG